MTHSKHTIKKGLGRLIKTFNLKLDKDDIKFIESRLVDLNIEAFERAIYYLMDNREEIWNNQNVIPIIRKQTMVEARKLSQLKEQRKFAQLKAGYTEQKLLENKEKVRNIINTIFAEEDSNGEID